MKILTLDPYGAGRCGMSQAKSISRKEAGRHACSDEAIWVHTSQVVFLAFLYDAGGRRCRGVGSTTFADGETWHFMDENGDRSVIRNTLLDLGRRIADLYEGTLHHEIIDSPGHAPCKAGE